MLTIFIIQNYQSNLAKGEVAVANPPSSSFVFARWQHSTDGLTEIWNCMFWLWVWHQICLSHWGQRPPSNNVPLDPTSVPAKSHLNPLNGLSKVHECERRQTTDRQTTLRRNVWGRRNRVRCDSDSVENIHVRPSLKHLRPKVFFIGPSNILVQFLGEIALCSARIHISPYRGLSDCRLTFVYPAPVKRIYMPFSRHTCGVQRATTQCAEWGSWPFKKKGNFGANCGQTVSPMLPPGKY